MYKIWTAYDVIKKMAEWNVLAKKSNKIGLNESRHSVLPNYFNYSSIALKKIKHKAGTLIKPEWSPARLTTLCGTKLQFYSAQLLIVSK